MTHVAAAGSAVAHLRHGDGRDRAGWRYRRAIPPGCPGRPILRGIAPSVAEISPFLQQRIAHHLALFRDGHSPAAARLPRLPPYAVPHAQRDSPPGACWNMPRPTARLRGGRDLSYQRRRRRDTCSTRAACTPGATTPSRWTTAARPSAPAGRWRATAPPAAAPAIELRAGAVQRGVMSLSAFRYPHTKDVTVHGFPTYSYSYSPTPTPTLTQGR